MNLSVYNKKKQRIIESLIDIKENINDEKTYKVIEDKINSLKLDTFTISVFGHFSNGKSTFLNVLMGFSDEILAEDELASTTTITRIKYSDDDNLTNKAKLKFYDGSEKIVDISDVKNYSARYRSSNNYNEELLEIELYLDYEILKNGIEIVDTPGFNSTHFIDTESAKSFVDKSDASIFLFSYDKPGSREEFKFLSQINEKMDKVFLVLNKVDKEDPTENTVEETIEDLRRKLLNNNVDVKLKSIYPVSAKLEKIGLKEGDYEKRKKAKILDFMLELENYLSSEENIKDRLFAPLKSTMVIISELIDLKGIERKNYSLENEDLKNKIDDLKSEIEDLRKELKDKRKEIKDFVSSKFLESRNEVESIANKIEEDIEEDLKDINSNFSLSTVAYINISERIKEDIDLEIKKVQKNLMINLTHVLEMYDDDNVYDIKRNILKSINLRLDINKIKEIKLQVKNDERVFTSIDKEIKKLEEDLQNKRNQWIKYNNEHQYFNDLKDKINKVDEDIKALRKEKTHRLMVIGEGRPHKFTKQITEYYEREGIFGKISKVFIGDKAKDINYEEWDYSEVEAINKQKEEIEKQYAIIEENIRAKNRLENDYKKFIGIEFLKAEAQNDYENAIDVICNKSLELENTKLEIEQKSVKFSVRKYKREINNYIDNLTEDIKFMLYENENNVRHTMQLILKPLENKLDKKNSELYNVKINDGLSKEELDEKIKFVSDEIVVLNEKMQKLKSIEEQCK